MFFGFELLTWGSPILSIYRGVLVGYAMAVGQFHKMQENCTSKNHAMHSDVEQVGNFRNCDWPSLVVILVLVELYQDWI